MNPHASASPWTASLLAMALGVALAACGGLAGGSPDAIAPRSAAASADTAAVGWYQTEGGPNVLVTWAPEGPDLRLLDFDTPRFASLERSDDTAFTWQVGDTTRQVTFEREPDGEVEGLRWRSDEGGSGFLPRAEEFPFDQHQVRFAHDSVELAGTLMIPRVRKLVGSSPAGMEEVEIVVPGAVVIHGSGTSDRDNVWAFHIAQHLARSGVAVLLPDKRGSGASGGDWRTADFTELAGDAIAATKVLERHPMVDAERIGFVGLSQGGWIAPIAAHRRPGTAFVIAVSGSAVPPGVQVRHEIEQDLRRAGLPEEGIGSMLALVDLGHRYIRSGSEEAWLAYDAHRTQLLEGPYSVAAEAAPGDRDDWYWTWWRDVIDYDPIPYWRELDAPALVVYGAEDERDNVPVAESVARLREALRPESRPLSLIRVFTGSGHALADEETGWIRLDFLELLSDWLKEAVGEERDR